MTQRLDKIISIDKIGIHTTVDIEVDGDHYFYINGVLTHNSAAGDTADVSEENIQGGIAKIQSADNVLAFIPNSKNAELGMIRAKLLKTRDSAGVGAYVDFNTDWTTLTFIPRAIDENNPKENNPTVHDSTPKQLQQFTKLEKPQHNDDKETKSASSVIRGIKGKASHQKKVKLL